jgi:AcrR family transcriptional regulator
MAEKNDTKRLTRDDWLHCAYKAVVDGGLADVRVLVLAERLGVTRGSFYWHFSDHRELIQALLQKWESDERALLAAGAAKHIPDPVQELDDLLDFALQRDACQLDSTRFELALRNQARHDEALARILHEIDVLRLKLFESKFLRMVQDRARARDLARIFYLAIVGCLHSLAMPGLGPDHMTMLKGLLTQYLVRPQATEVASLEQE